MVDAAVGGLPLSARPIDTYSNINGSPSYTVSGVGTAQGYPKNNGADFGPDSSGDGYQILTPNGVRTTTSGFNECMDTVQHAGGGVVEVVSPLTGFGQFVWRSSAQLRDNGFLITSTAPASCLNPFITDPEVVMGGNSTNSQGASDASQLYVSNGGVDRFDVVINTLGGSTVSSPWNYANSSASYYSFIYVTAGTVASITLNGIPFTTYAFGVFAVKPGGTLQVTWSGGSTNAPYISQLAAATMFGPSVGCAFDVRVTDCKHSSPGIFTGWVNSQAVYIGNSGPNRGVRFSCLDGCGNGLRIMGGGPANVMAGVNTLFEYVEVKGYGYGGYGIGGAATPAFGIDFAGNCDHNGVLFANLQSDGNGEATNGSSCVAYNDGQVSATTDLRVNSNFVQWGITVCNQVGEHVILSNRAGSTAAESANIFNNFNGDTPFSPGPVTTAVQINTGGIFSGYDRGLNNTWNQSKQYSSGPWQSTKYTSNLSGAASTSTSQVIVGLTSSFQGVPFEPLGSGLMDIVITGCFQSGATVVKVTLQGKITTTPNSEQNGPTTAYTNICAQQLLYPPGASDTGQFILDSFFAGEPDTIYYIDIGQAVASGGTVTLTQINVKIKELPW